MSYSQEDKVGNWLMYFGTNRISDNFSIHTEIQFRNYTITPNNVILVITSSRIKLSFF